MKNIFVNNKYYFRLTVVVLVTLAFGTLANQALAGTTSGISFQMVTSAGTADCLPDSSGWVKVATIGDTENQIMNVVVWGLPPDTDFDFFVTQVPGAPFGLSWYQGDIHTNAQGVGQETFIGKFNLETFIVAPGETSAPQVHTDSPFADADTNPATGPVHTFHLGLWFNSAEDAAWAGCPDIVTPFNGEHNAGVQVLNTANFPDNEGPLSMLE